MLTPKEYIANGIPDNHEIWLNGLDIITHCLQKDTSKTFFKNRPSSHTWDNWQQAMSDRAQADDNFQDIYDNAYQPKQEPRTMQSESGDFVIDYYLDKEELMFEEHEDQYMQGDAVSVVIDICLPYMDRDKSYMIKRHQDVYDIIAQCDSDNRPIQVVGAFEIGVPELKKHLKIFVMIKDYTDSIFPSIWGTLKTNESTNDFLNVMMDYFIGTRSGTNGKCKTMKQAENYFPMNEELIIYGKRIEATNTKNRSI